MLIKRLKAIGFMVLGYSPIIAGIIVLLYIWCIRLPYQSSFYYYDSYVYCSDCQVSLGADNKFCPQCSKTIEEIASVMEYKHCSFCNSNVLYKNDSTNYCKECGKELTGGNPVKLSNLGFSSVKDFRNAKTEDNTYRLISNKFIASIITIIVVIIVYGTIKQSMINALNKKIIKQGIANSKKIKDY
jgi:ribosomal protein L37AE/L43A